MWNDPQQFFSEADKVRGYTRVFFPRSKSGLAGHPRWRDRICNWAMKHRHKNNNVAAQIIESRKPKGDESHGLNTD